MRALSIRQPFAELILRGVKTAEYRSRPTRIVGERFYIYASKSTMPVEAIGKGEGRAWSTDLSMVGKEPGDGPPPWMLELAQGLILGDDLPRGVIVGTARISHVSGPVQPSDLGLQPYYLWHLADVERVDAPRKPIGHPQPVWFKPF